MNHERFDLAHYVHMLSQADLAGYRFVTFDREPEPGDMFLRHDVDFDPQAAAVMAAIEEAMRVQATYLWMTSSELYSLEAPSVVEVVEGVRRTGHQVGWHPRRHDGARPTRPGLGPYFAWHNPGDQYALELPGWVNVMGQPWQADAADAADAAATGPRKPLTLASKGTRPDQPGRAAAAGAYRSDSNQRWRQGRCPCHELRAGKFEWIHLLVHPEVWVYPGASMKETMMSMLDADARRRRGQVAADEVDLPAALLPGQATLPDQVTAQEGQAS